MACVPGALYKRWISTTSLKKKPQRLLSRDHESEVWSRARLLDDVDDGRTGTQEGIDNPLTASIIAR